MSAARSSMQRRPLSSFVGAPPSARAILCDCRLQEESIQAIESLSRSVLLAAYGSQSTLILNLLLVTRISGFAPFI